MGAVDKFQILQVRKMVKEDLFKKVKFITTSKIEESAMTYLARKFSVKTEEEADWKATYSHFVRDALNNKRNNTAQDLKKALEGKTIICCIGLLLLCTHYMLYISGSCRHGCGQCFYFAFCEREGPTKLNLF